MSSAVSLMASPSISCSSASPALIVAAHVNLTQIDCPIRVSYKSRPLNGRGSPLAGPVFKVSASVNSTVAANVVPQSISPKEKKEVRVPDAASISTLMNHVANLIELVDSQDIVELQLKQTECEIIIRKKDALQPLPVVPPAFMMHPPPPPPSVATAPSPISKSVLVPCTAPAALPPKPSTSSHPHFKSPMAGTFYRSPAPGAPPLVKVGDKVQKGQVVCIIEAMKLMNEIEADQAGTVLEILIDDAKLVSVDTPLFVIAP